MTAQKTTQNDCACAPTIDCVCWSPFHLVATTVVKTFANDPSRRMASFTTVTQRNVFSHKDSLLKTITPQLILMPIGIAQCSAFQTNVHIFADNL